MTPTVLSSQEFDGQGPARHPVDRIVEVIPRPREAFTCRHPGNGSQGARALCFDRYSATDPPHRPMPWNLDSLRSNNLYLFVDVRSISPDDCGA